MGRKKVAVFDGISVRVASRLAHAAGRRASSPHSRAGAIGFPGEVRDPGAQSCGGGVLARSRRPGNRMREWLHERERPPCRPASSLRLAELLRREHVALADFLVALAEFDASAGTAASVTPTSSTTCTGNSAFHGSGALPEGGGPARCPLSGGGRAPARRAPLPLLGPRARKGHHRSEPPGGASSILPPLPRGGEGGRRGDRSGVGDPAEDGRHAAATGRAVQSPDRLAVISRLRRFTRVNSRAFAGGARTAVEPLTATRSRSTSPSRGNCSPS